MSLALPYDPDQVPAGPRRALLERAPTGSSVLDVGCWSGFAGRHLMRTRSATVDEVEPVPEMAAEAAAHYREVVAQRAEEAIGRLAAAGRRYDVVLLLDVLEHLVQPAAVLEAVHDVVRPGGRVLVSLPNIAHWSTRKELLLGRWDYRDSGLLDRTHLRFYTRRTAGALLRDAGWRVTFQDFAFDRVPLVQPPDRILRRRPELFAVQLLFDAVPA